MTLHEAKKEFVTYRNLMRKLGISNNCYLHWRNQGYIPFEQQVMIERLTNGRLKANDADRRKRGTKDNY